MPTHSIESASLTQRKHVRIRQVTASYAFAALLSVVPAFFPSFGYLLSFFGLTLAISLIVHAYLLHLSSLVLRGLVDRRWFIVPVAAWAGWMLVSGVTYVIAVQARSRMYAAEPAASDLRGHRILVFSSWEGTGVSATTNDAVFLERDPSLIVYSEGKEIRSATGEACRKAIAADQALRSIHSDGGSDLSWTRELRFERHLRGVDSGFCAVGRPSNQPVTGLFITRSNDVNRGLMIEAFNVEARRDNKKIHLGTVSYGALPYLSPLPLFGYDCSDSGRCSPWVNESSISVNFENTIHYDTSKLRLSLIKKLVPVKPSVH